MINKKKIMQSVSLIVLTAVLYGNAYAPKKDMPQPDFKGFTKACATQEMIASSLHNADYITSTHPNTMNMRSVSNKMIHQWLQRLHHRRRLNGQDQYFMQIITVRYMRIKR